MRVFMLGWEFPPYISGGLGTACYGLTRALSRAGVSITFVLPRAIDGTEVTHVRLLGATARPNGNGHHGNGHRVAGEPSAEDFFVAGDPACQNVAIRTVDAKLLSPYQSVGGVLHDAAVGQSDLRIGDGPGMPVARGSDLVGDLPSREPGDPGTHSGRYEGDLVAEAHRYALECVDVARRETFDVIHAHDWLTFPAGMAVAAAFGKPLVVHVHSTEFDRAGEHIHQQVYDIERRGMHAAIRVVAVSYLTGAIVEHRYGVEPDRIDVVYNGIEEDGKSDMTPQAVINRGDRIVLFLGRITMQKGPEYFIMAAKKVLEKVGNVKFVMAGTGDKIGDVIELAAREGIGQRVLFTGFLRGEDVSRVYRMADVYVMPSVSEPFGIAPLEAIRHDVPVIISKTSGVSEVLTHALKVDFWDTDEIANKIIAVLSHPPLSTTLREQADIEVRRLSWDDAASRCVAVYKKSRAATSA